MDKERHNFLSGAVAREPGKRQIKPNAAFFDEQQLLPCGEDDDEEDEDVIFPLSNESRCSDDDESGESANGGDSSSQSADERQSDDSGGNSSDDEASDTDNNIDQKRDTRDDFDHNHKIAAGIQLDAEGGASTSNNNNNNLITMQQQQQLLKKRKRGVGKNNKKINGLMGHQNDDGTKQETVADPSTEPADGSSEAQLCAICLNLRPADQCGELIRCDRCALSVHELCYCAVVVEDDGGGGSGEHQQAAATTTNNSLKHPQQEELNNQPKNGHLPPIASSSATADTQSVVSSASTEPWFCEPCLFNVADVPHCELCPSRYGAFKKAVFDAGGGWVHVLCAAFTPGVSFTEALSAVSWRGIDTRAFGRKACAGCCNSGSGKTPPHALGARTGITVQCDAGMCKHFYHVTCAQRLGLLIDLESEAHRHQRDGIIFGTSNNNNHRQQNGKSGCGAVAVRSTETVHSEVGYLYCKKHAPKDVSVLRMKNAYAKFVESEERRMVRWNRVSLTRARSASVRYSFVITSNACVTMRRRPPQSQQRQHKRAKLLHTNSRIFNAFSEMHELLGFDGEQLAGEFSAVPAAQLPFSLTPTFSKTFVSYMEHRDLVGLPGEDVRLTQLNRELAQRQRQQKEAERKLEELRKINGDTQRAHADQQLLLEQFRSVLIKLAPNSPLLLSTAETLPPEANKKMPMKRKRRSSKSSDGAKSPEIMPKTVAPSHPIRQTKSIQPNTSVAKTKTGPAADDNNNAGGDAAQTVSKTETKSVVNAAAVPPLSSQCHKCSKWFPPRNSFRFAIDAHRLVYCDTCKYHYHIGCLDPPLAKMPAKSKFSRFECSDCACPSETDGTEGEGEKGEDGTYARKDEVSNKASSSKDWSLLQNRGKRQRRTPRSSSFVSIA